ncbi:MAG: aldehyde dehydrogenase family protein [Clostridiales Family XIII bacterium]|jgi:succinate-semialdehyde dehydrogenase|nr:aldehyde dehydrogenase family protein [Clostridiales Family XIII bacterium]
MENAMIIDRMIDNAKQALDAFRNFNQEQIDGCVKAMLLAFKAEAETLSKEVIAETGLGHYESKLEKNTGSPDAIWYALKGRKSVGVIGEDREKGLKFVAQPKGILSSVAPTTNPNITVLFNAAFAVKGRNVLIVAPHPRAKKTTLHTVEILNGALRAQGAPENVLQCVEEPSIELTRLLMKQSNVIIATGGAAMVESAYSSGRPAFGVGPGNVQTIIDQGFDYAEAAAQIAVGRKFDNGLICAGNQSVIMPKSDEDRIVAALKENGVHYVEDPAEVEKFRGTLFPDGRHINGALVGRSAPEVAEAVGADVPEGTEVIMLKGDSARIGAADPLCGEKMCPVLISLTYDAFEEAVEIAKTNLLYQGAGHSAVLHTYDEKKMEYAGVTLPVSRLLINQPGIFAANPALANGFNPTSTLGCGSWGNNSISENLTFEHLINISRIGMIRGAKDIPSVEQIWED